MGPTVRKVLPAAAGGTVLVVGLGAVAFGAPLSWFEIFVGGMAVFFVSRSFLQPKKPTQNP